jgi:hypothetical protein
MCEKIEIDLDPPPPFGHPVSRRCSQLRCRKRPAEYSTDRGFSYRLSRAYLFNANIIGTPIAQGFSGAVMFFVQVYALQSGMLLHGIPLQGVYAAPPAFKVVKA